MEGEGVSVTGGRQKRYRLDLGDYDSDGLQNSMALGFLKFHYLFRFRSHDQRYLDYLKSHFCD